MSKADQEFALLQRITELVQAPTLVPLIDHYLDQLAKLREEDNQDARW